MRGLRVHCRYEGGFSASDAYVQEFWEVMEVGRRSSTLSSIFFQELDMEHKRKFLIFCTGADRAPLGGLKVSINLIQSIPPCYPATWSSNPKERCGTY